VHQFVNAIHIKTGDQGAVLDALTEVLARAGYDPVAALEGASDDCDDPTRSRIRHFLVTPSVRGWVSVFDENFVEIFDLPPRLSAEMKCPALLLWGRGDQSWGYALSDEGRRIDEFSTDPNYLEGESAGQPEVLCEYGEGTADQFKTLFAEGKESPRASMRVFAKLFGIRNAESDYEDLSVGDQGDVVGYEEFVQLTFLRR
jgi:hypothetical protein